ncbi:MAG: hypothetical protein ACXAAI_15780 [Promethearchaeota archaeon]|jgi:hypothetical protein
MQKRRLKLDWLLNKTNKKIDTRINTKLNPAKTPIKKKTNRAYPEIGMKVRPNNIKNHERINKIKIMT